MVTIGDRIEHTEDVLIDLLRQLFPFQSILQRQYSDSNIQKANLYLEK